jgi:predicted nucleic acid-binding protein
MKYILDSCVGVKWLLQETDSDKSLRVRDGFRQGMHELIAPDVLPVEIAHALTRAERQGRISPADGAIRLQDFFTTLPILHPYLPLLPRAYQLSSLARIGVYDCLYVVLAEQEGCELQTADDRLARNLSSHPIVLLSSLPDDLNTSPRFTDERPGRRPARRRFGR